MAVPKTLDEVLALLPGVRRMRQLNADLLRTLTDRQKGECTWCGGPVGKGRKTWCGDACVVAFNHRCSANHYRAAVVKRDQGICRSCGRDVVESEQKFNLAEREVKKLLAEKHGSSVNAWNVSPLHRAELDLEIERLRLEFGFARGGFFEVEHTVPVCEGGGLCELDLLHLYCGACHARSTKELSGRRKRK